MTDLLLVGSKHVFRQALGLVLAYEIPECCVRAQANTPGEALAFVRAGIPADLAIVDLDERPGHPLDLVDVIGLLSQMRLHRPDLALIALTGAAPESYWNYGPASNSVELIHKTKPLGAILERIQQACQSHPSACAAAEEAVQADRYHSAR